MGEEANGNLDSNVQILHKLCRIEGKMMHKLSNMMKSKIHATS